MEAWGIVLPFILMTSNWVPGGGEHAVVHVVGKSIRLEYRLLVNAQPIAQEAVMKLKWSPDGMMEASWKYLELFE